MRKSPFLKIASAVSTTGAIVSVALAVSATVGRGQGAEGPNICGSGGNMACDGYEICCCAPPATWECRFYPTHWWMVIWT